QKLKEHPELAHNAQFMTQVGWLVQDWKEHSGTQMQPWLPPTLSAQLQDHAIQCPGLVQEDLKDLLVQSSTLSDRSLVNDIRAQALALSTLPPEAQEARQYIKAAARLELRAEASASPTKFVEALTATETEATSAEQVADTPRVAPVAPPDATLDTEPHGTEERSAAAVEQPSAQPDDNVARAVSPEEAQQDVSAPQPEATQDEHGAPQEPASAPQSSDTAPATNVAPDAPSAVREDLVAPAQQGAPEHVAEAPVEEASVVPQQPTAQRHQETEGAHDFGEGQTGYQRPNSGQTPAKTLTKEGPSLQEEPSQHQGETQPSPGVIRPTISDHAMSMFNKLSEKKEPMAPDIRRVQALSKIVSDTLHTIGEDRAEFESVGREFFEQFNKTLQTTGASREDVIKGMTTDGPYKDLRHKFDETYQSNPSFRKLHDRLKENMSRATRQYSTLISEVKGRGMSTKEHLAEPQRKLHDMGKSLDGMPSRDSGRSLLQAAGEMAEKLVKKIMQVFFDRDQKIKREQSVSTSHAPAP
ncbi:hypothetical protein, partial [Neokomagataea thailandica]